MTPGQVTEALAGELPAALLVLGPGAWNLVTRCSGPDWLVREALDADGARSVRDEAQYMPTGDRRVFALNMQGSSLQVQNMLLKVLEEPPPGTFFVLASEDTPMRTVTSRCRVLVLGQEEAVEPDQGDVSLVAAAVRAARQGRPSQLTRAVAGWKPAHAYLLATWAAEAASGCWRVFDASSAGGVTPEQALRVLTGLSAFQGGRLAPRVALERAFTGQ